MVSSTQFEYTAGEHNGRAVIFIRFPFDLKLIAEVKKLPGARWSSSKKAWYVTDRADFREKFGMPRKNQLKNNLLKIHPANHSILREFIAELQMRAYSINTIETYRKEFAQLLYFIGEKTAEGLSVEDIKEYLLYCSVQLKLSENQINSRFNAIKFYFEKVLKREKMFFHIPRPQKPSRLPKVIDSRDIKKMFQSTTNLKHNTILKLCYGMGLRVSEIVNLKVTDIDSKRMQVFIERSKGKKDRYVNLPESILEQLRDYYKQYKPKFFLFEGQFGGKYSIRSAQLIFKEAMRRAHINKKVGIHGLRHSYATHLLEAGTELGFIQQLLGHNDIKTTLIYAQVGKRELGKVKSPLDSL